MDNGQGYLTIRDDAGVVLGRPYVGERSVRWATPCRATLREFRDSNSDIQLWVAVEVEKLLIRGIDPAPLLATVVTACDESQLALVGR